MIQFRNVTKEYITGGQKVIALDSVSFEIQSGELTVILGPSGSGKSTVLNLLGGMDRASSGSIEVNGKDITMLSDHELSVYRRYEVGFIFQFYNLIPNLTASENVGIAAQLTGNARKTAETLNSVGLSHRMDNFPSQLSGGEMQRVAIARALAKSPKLLLCDEPTGALDSNTGRRILHLLMDAAKNPQTAVVLVTHNETIADVAHQIIHLHDGKISQIARNENINCVEEVL